LIACPIQIDRLHFSGDREKAENQALPIQIDRLSQKKALALASAFFNEIHLSDG